MYLIIVYKVVQIEQGRDKMQKRKFNLNTLYFSDRLQAELRGIGRHALTLVVAPMGYGKTTAVNWYLGECAQQPGTRVVRISMYSDSLPIFWQSVQYAFDRAGYDVLQGYDCPQDAATAAMLIDDLNDALTGPDACYIFLDDFHLLQDHRSAVFLVKWALRLPENVHIIVATRDRHPWENELVQLGSRVCVFGPKQLRLDKAGLGAYIRRCGGELSDADVEKLLFATEGWFSAVYLSLQTLEDRGTLPDKSSDIYDLFTAAMIDPLPPMQQEFLTVLGLADEFTIEMAEAVTGRADAAALLAELTSRNAFVKRLPDSDLYRCHHVMKDCAALDIQILTGGGIGLVIIGVVVLVANFRLTLASQINAAAVGCRVVRDLAVVQVQAALAIHRIVDSRKNAAATGGCCVAADGAFVHGHGSKTRGIPIVRGAATYADAAAVACRIVGNFALI